MKFSVLLPTRNRLEYLKYAVETVKRQDYTNWEIIISDNCSDDDIVGFVETLKDDRIYYVRTSTFIPVTDNWNNALKHSSGDYVVMLGDDDGLLPDYFSTIIEAFKTFPNPDFVYGGAVFYAYPGVMPGAPDGFLRYDKNAIFNSTQPEWLGLEQARAIGQGYLNFRMPVASNMQFSLISRRKIDELTYDGKFFHSPFPDFYATPLLFMASSNILILPQPIAIIGISPKSYGFYHFNSRPSLGVEFLNNTEQLAHGLKYIPEMLPGTSYNDSWLIANVALYQNFAQSLGLSQGFNNYRRLQILHGYKHRYFDQNIDHAEFYKLLSKMTFGERFLYSPFFRIGFSILRLVPGTLREKLVGRLRKAIGQHAMSARIKVEKPLRNLVEAFEYIEQNLALIQNR